MKAELSQRLWEAIQKEQKREAIEEVDDKQDEENANPNLQTKSKKQKQATKKTRTTGRRKKIVERYLSQVHNFSHSVLFDLFSSDGEDEKQEEPQISKESDKTEGMHYISLFVAPLAHRFGFDS